MVGAEKKRTLYATRQQFFSPPCDAMVFIKRDRHVSRWYSQTGQSHDIGKRFKKIWRTTISKNIYIAIRTDKFKLNSPAWKVKWGGVTEFTSDLGVQSLKNCCRELKFIARKIANIWLISSKWMKFVSWITRVEKKIWIMNRKSNFAIRRVKISIPARYTVNLKTNLRGRRKMNNIIVANDA